MTCLICLNETPLFNNINCAPKMCRRSRVTARDDAAARFGQPSRGMLSERRKAIDRACRQPLLLLLRPSSTLQSVVTRYFYHLNGQYIFSDRFFSEVRDTIERSPSCSGQYNYIIIKLSYPTCPCMHNIIRAYETNLTRESCHSSISLPLHLHRSRSRT